MLKSYLKPVFTGGFCKLIHRVLSWSGRSASNHGKGCSYGDNPLSLHSRAPQSSAVRLQWGELCVSEALHLETERRCPGTLLSHEKLRHRSSLQFNSESKWNLCIKCQRHLIALQGYCANCCLDGWWFSWIDLLEEDLHPRACEQCLALAFSFWEVVMCGAYFAVPEYFKGKKITKHKKPTVLCNYFLRKDATNDLYLYFAAYCNVIENPFLEIFFF